MVKTKQIGWASEAELTRAVFAWLQAHRILAWRMPVGPVVHRKVIGGRLKEFWKKSPLKGFPDIAGVLQRKRRGTLFTLELKSASGSISPEQKMWMKDLSDAGSACAVIRSIDDLRTAMETWGEITPPQSHPPQAADELP